MFIILVESDFTLIKRILHRFYIAQKILIKNGLYLGTLTTFHHLMNMIRTFFSTVSRKKFPLAAPDTYFKTDQQTTKEEKK